MKNKKFRDLSNGRIVNVTDQFEDIVILDNKNKIRINQLMDRRLFEEQLDPNNFLKNEGLINSFAEQIKKIPLDNWDNRMSLTDAGFNEPTNEPAVIPYDPEIEKLELLKKAQSIYNNQNPKELVKKQMDSLKGIIEEEDLTTTVYQPDVKTELPIQNSQQQSPQKTIEQQQSKSEIKMDPILEMFKNVKRNTSFKIEFTVENKIPRVDFIEMMEDSYNTSIIDFLAQEFTEEILKDPNIIKEKIKDKLTGLVYPDVENKMSK